MLPLPVGLTILVVTPAVLKVSDIPLASTFILPLVTLATSTISLYVLPPLYGAVAASVVIGEVLRNFNLA